MTAFVVVNPSSDNGRTGRDWPRIRRQLETIFPQMTVARTRDRGDTARLVRSALKDGHLDIVAVGGDGTINEAVNGFFEHGHAVSPDAVLGVVPSGTSSDFGRSLGVERGYEAGIARLKRARIRRVDLGLVSCVSLRGEPIKRYFVNGASFGLSGRVAKRLNGARLARLFGGKFAFAFHALRALLGWHSQKVRLIIKGDLDEVAGITSVAIANGGWFGGGLEVAPDADPADGMFDIVIIAGASRRRILLGRKSLLAGRIPPAETVPRATRAVRLTAAPTVETEGPVEIETDGESAGLLPATFEILPNALKLRC